MVFEYLQTSLRKSVLHGLKKVGYPAAQVLRDLHYGPVSQQKLDLYLPAGGPPRMRLVFFHGGSWRSGHKDEYAFLGNTLAAHGIGCAVVGYRLYPQVRYPAFVEDAALAVAWLRREGARHGWGEGPLHLMGHSAGAHIACLLALDERYRELAQLGRDDIGGVIGLAGVYRFRPETDPVYADIFASAGPDFEAVKPINFVGEHKAPLLLLHGSRDSLVLPKTAQRMYEAASRAGQKVQLHIQPGYGHVRPLFDFVPFMPNHRKTMNLLLSFLAGEPA